MDIPSSKRDNDDNVPREGSNVPACLSANLGADRKWQWSLPVHHAPQEFFIGSDNQSDSDLSEFVHVFNGSDWTQVSDFVKGTADPDQVMWPCSMSLHQLELAAQDPVSTYGTIFFHGHIKESYPMMNAEAEARSIRQAAAFAAAAPTSLEAMSVAHRWFIDTGCGHGLIGLYMAACFQQYIEETPMFKFRIASPKYAATKCLPVYVEAFESETCDGNAATYIMSKTSPAVLSVGLRGVHQGFSFIWAGGKDSCNDCPQSQDCSVRC